MLGTDLDQNTTLCWQTTSCSSVLTVCMCFSSISLSLSLFPPLRGEDIELHLGEHHIGYKDGPGQFIAPAVIIPHPEYDRYTINNDIMLMKLTEPAKLDEYVQPIALPSSCAPAGTQCLVSWWGATKSPCKSGMTQECTSSVPKWSSRRCLVSSY